MRGRVGRSNKKAFCYLLAPPLSSLTPEAKRRLQAIENFSDLGSGIHIAMQDLDIRGILWASLWAIIYNTAQYGDHFTDALK